MKPTHYFDPLYRKNFYFCIGWRPADFDRYMVKEFNYKWASDGKDGCTNLVTFSNGSLGLVIWIKRKKDYVALAHECVHAANFVLSRVGVKADFDNDEPQAYYIGLIMQKALGL